MNLHGYIYISLCVAWSFLVILAGYERNKAHEKESLEFHKNLSWTLWLILARYKFNAVRIRLLCRHSKNQLNRCSILVATLRELIENPGKNLSSPHLGMLSKMETAATEAAQALEEMAVLLDKDIQAITEEVEKLEADKKHLAN